MISYPLGGVGAGSIGLGGRGQLRDWEIFNRPDQGNSMSYAFASIWVQAEGEKPAVHVLEARIEPPYGGGEGLGSRNVPGLSRLEGATFIGEFAAPRIEFHDKRLPIEISLEAISPFIPLDADESGLPLVMLRYRVRNRVGKRVTASIAWSIENPVKFGPNGDSAEAGEADKRRENEHRNVNGLEGLLMTNPTLAKDHVENGSFALALTGTAGGRVTVLRGWPAGRWWNSPLLFWDDFSKDGELGPEAEHTGPIGAVCLKRELEPHAEAEYTFVVAWHFPNRTPKRCGWDAPKGHENDVIGNWYASRFPDAWAAAEYGAAHLAELEKRTQNFVRTIRETTVPGEVKDAALSNLSTLISTTCFRTADGEFHAFEGSNDHIGCCFGNCTHVWNYETATANLFPSLAHSLRRAAFGFSMDERGGMYFRQLLPDGISRFGYIAADGQMGQIMKVYQDWQLSGDEKFLNEFWPKVKRAIEFAWIPGGWDANKDGVMEGVQHNTYDVEFYGPNPLCGVYYLGALRAAEEMATAAGAHSEASTYRDLFEKGSRWMDQNLFNGEYYVQRVEGHAAKEIATGLRSGMGADDSEHPQFQVGEGCLLDQLLGQYLADVCGLGALLDRDHTRKTLDALHRYNHKANLFNHENVQRTYALNDEGALMVCDYGKAERPQIPFPYYAETWTGQEHAIAALFLFHGMTDHGLESIANVRRRYDGVRRNPWDEPECGHHYARALSSWSSLLALSGFQYFGSERRVVVAPRIEHAEFRSFWSAGTGWGRFVLTEGQLTIEVIEGSLRVREVRIGNRSSKRLPEERVVEPGKELLLRL